MDLAARPPSALAFRDVYAAGAPFVWRTLRRLGVREADVEDACQEVFVVVHGKLATFVGGSLKAWLFAIARRVASDHRRRASTVREVPDEAALDVAMPESQTATLDRARALRLLERALAGLSAEKREVFVLFELEELPMAEVAEAVGCPLQTAYSRLYAAREHVEAAVARQRAREARSLGEARALDGGGERRDP